MSFKSQQSATSGFSLHSIESPVLRCVCVSEVMFLIFHISYCQFKYRKLCTIRLLALASCLVHGITSLLLSELKMVRGSTSECFSRLKTTNRQCRPRLFYSQGRQLPCARHPVLKPTHLRLLHFFLLAQNLSSRITPTDNMWPKLHDEYLSSVAKGLIRGHDGSGRSSENHGIKNTQHNILESTKEEIPGYSGKHTA